MGKIAKTGSFYTKSGGKPNKNKPKIDGFCGLFLEKKQLFVEMITNEHK
jgi:hypothetical protein